MAGDADNSVSAVEIVTQSYAVVGRCHGLNAQIRLIDLLNRPELTHLELSNVKVRDLSSAREIASTDGPFFIDKDYVVFGRSLESPQTEAQRRESHRVDFVEKARHRMLVFARPFRLLGTVHLVKDVDFSVALPRLFEGFLAMTECGIEHEVNAALTWESKFIAVNGHRIEMVCAAPNGDCECQTDGASEEDQEDWDTDELSRLLNMT